MKVTIDTDPMLDDDQSAALATNLGVDRRALPAAMNKLAMIALKELLDMATGRDIYDLSGDTLEKRLEYFILLYYVDRLPTESEISRLFQITPPKAKILLTNLNATRRHVIEQQRTQTIRKILESPRRVAAVDIELTIQSPYIIDAIKELIELHASGLGSITKKRGTIDTYEVSVDTFNRIAPTLGVAVQPLEFNA